MLALIAGIAMPVSAMDHQGQSEGGWVGWKLVAGVTVLVGAGWIYYWYNKSAKPERRPSEDPRGKSAVAAPDHVSIKPTEVPVIAAHVSADTSKQVPQANQQMESAVQSKVPRANQQAEVVSQKMEIPKAFETVFMNWPDFYQKVILEYYVTNTLFDNLANIEDEKIAYAKAYAAIAQHFKSSTNLSSGYFYFKPGELMHGQRVEKSSCHWNVEANRRLAVQNYKIHLMPKTEDIPGVLIRLLEELQSNHEFSSAVKEFKVLEDTQDLSDGRGNILPIIVVYPASGKQHAQKVLDTLYRILKDFAGLDKTPRYNQRVTDLLYFAQGNGADKGPLNLHFSGDQIYYKPDFVTKGVYEDYKLIIPTN